MALQIAKGLALPDDAVTQTFGVLAVRGAGKTNTAVVMAEEMDKAKLPFVVVDPVGVWWGLRSSGNGKGPGLSIPVLGGDHGDVPLEATGGHVVANMIADRRVSCVLDVSDFSEADKIRFLIGFAEQLYRVNRDPLHLFLEEADDYAPQRPMRDQARLLGAWQRIVRRGRSRGLGITMITQRSAALNKDVLTQIETLFVLRTTSPQDRKAIEGWVEYHNERRDILESLPTLKDGEAWVWSPHWLGRLERLQIRRRWTYDSAATPRQVRGRARPSATLADIDLSVLKEQMAETIERAKAEDPKELRRRIAQLEKELRRAQSVVQPEPVVERVEVPILQDATVERLAELSGYLKEQGSAVEALGRSIIESVSRRERSRQDLTRERTDPGRKLHTPRPQPSARPTPPRTERREQSRQTGDVAPLREGARRMLDVMASRHPMTTTRAQLATLARLKKRGGTFGTYFSDLRTRGLIEVSGNDVRITEAGMDQAGTVLAEPQTTEEILGMWRARLRAGARRMFDVLVGIYPEATTRDGLAEAVELERGGGTFGTYLSDLRTNGLIEDEGGTVRASESLFT